MVAGLLSALTACAAPPGPPAAPTPSLSADSSAASPLSGAPSSATPTPGRATVQPVLETLLDAARSADRPAFDRQISDRDPGFTAMAASWYTTISTISWAELDLTAQPDRATVSAARRRELGGPAWVQSVAVRWRLPGSRRPAIQRIWLTFLPAVGAPRLAGSTDAPGSAATTSQPLWWQGPAAVAAWGDVTVLAGGSASQRADRWLRRTEPAVEAVRRRLGRSSAYPRTEPVVLEVPATQQAFERVLGVAPGSYAQIAAVAWPMGPDPASAPIHVVVNPGVATELPTQALAVLLTHEAVHVATHSPDSPAPTWLVEGYADQIAYAAYPDTRRAAAEPALAAVRADGPPDHFPADQDFAAGSPELEVAYARAWLLCRFLADRYGTARLDRLYASIDRGTDPGQAVSTVLGTTHAALLAGWRRDLDRLARDPTW